jgi:hypothetical protein
MKENIKSPQAPFTPSMGVFYDFFDFLKKSQVVPEGETVKAAGGV